MKQVLIAVALLAASAAAGAAEPLKAPPKAPPTEADMKQAMEASMAMFVPVLVKMTEGIIEAKLAIAEKPETAARIASYKRNLYDAYLKKGFSRDEAMALTVSAGLPSAMPEIP